jgi:hypothetical protein
MTIPSAPAPAPAPALPLPLGPAVVGGVPLLDPPLLLPRDDDEEDTVRITGASRAGGGVFRQKNSLASQRLLRSARSFSSRLRSKAER